MAKLNSGTRIYGNLQVDTFITASGNVVAASSQASTSTTTGALVVVGGAGIGGNINIGGTTNYFAGNVGVGQSLVAGWYGQQPMMVVSKSQNAETIFGIGNPTVGASASATLRIIGGTGNSYHISGINDNNGAPVYQDDMGTGILHRQWTTAGTERLKLTSAGNLVITATTATTDSTTGAFVVRGGVGIAGNVEVGTTGASAVRAGAFVTNVLNLDPGSGNIAARFGKNTTQAGTGIIGWNRSGGAGEMAFVQNKAAGSSGGFMFYEWANTAINSTTAVFSIAGTGNVTVYGNITPSANLTYNLGSPTAWYNTFYGVSTQAKYADLAENYVGDTEYAPGTVLVFGGEQEVTITTVSHDTRVAGVVSTNPAYLMNAASGNVAVAMTGRVPCQVLGPVNKGTVLVTSNTAGVAEALNSSMYRPGCVIGKALEKIDGTHIKTIEVVVGRF